MIHTKDSLPSQNIVLSWISPGLRRWADDGAQVCFLQSPNREVVLPKIIAPAINTKTIATVINIAGQHLEETSGPGFCLNADNFSKARECGIDFVIYPVVNTRALHYPEDGDEGNLRYDCAGRNLNDGWGRSNLGEKALEVDLIEKDIEKEELKRRFVLGIAHHEDSEKPNIGFVFTLKFSQPTSENLAAQLRRSPVRHHLANFHNGSLGPDSTYGGIIEYGCIIANSHDPWSFEDHLTQSLGIPTVVIEAPSGRPLKERLQFHKAAFDILTKNLV